MTYINKDKIGKETYTLKIITKLLYINIYRYKYVIEYS